MSYPPIRCFSCRTPLDHTTGENARIELNPDGGGEEGFHVGYACTECESELAEKLK